jgi:hypothetical protein
MMFATPKEKPKTASQGRKRKSAGTRTTTGNVTAASLPRVIPLHRKLAVGPAAEFKTIGAALADAKKNVNPHSKARQTITVAGGTYAERIVLGPDAPHGIHLVAEEGQEVVLAPVGAAPVVEIKGKAENFQLKGFRIDGSGKEVAIRVSDWLSQMHLENLVVTGFTQAGIVAAGPQSFGDEREKIVFDNIVFRPGTPQAMGIQLKKGADSPAHVRISGCRFLGPLAIGVLFDADSLDITIANSIFHQAKIAIQLDGASRIWRDIVFSNNTFSQDERGIVFANMPAPGTSGLRFYNNLFLSVKAPAVAVDQGFKEVDFLGSMIYTAGTGIANNWTDAPAPAKPLPSELKIFGAGGGKMGVTGLTYLSNDPTNSDFLAPAPKSPQASVGGPQAARFGPQVGAAPKQKPGAKK